MNLRLGSAERTPCAAAVADTLLRRNVIPGGCSGVLARTELIRDVGGFDENLANFADYDLWIRLSQAAELTVIDRPLVGYRIHNGGMAHNVGRSERELEYVERKYRAMRSARGVVLERERFLWYFGGLYLRQGDRVQSMRIHRDIALNCRDRRLRALGLAVGGGLWPGMQRLRDQARSRRLPPAWRVEADSWLAALR